MCLLKQRLPNTVESNNRIAFKAINNKDGKLCSIFHNTTFSSMDWNTSDKLPTLHNNRGFCVFLNLIDIKDFVDDRLSIYKVEIKGNRIAGIQFLYKGSNQATCLRVHKFKIIKKVIV